MHVGYVKIAFYDWSRNPARYLRRLTAENLCPSATVFCVHDSALAKEHAVSSTFNSDASRNLMIIVTVQLTSTRLVVWLSTGSEVE